MNTDHIYWTFSAAAQSISAFVAFLLTGYALVHTLMEAEREKDDTLEEIHSVLLLNYHKRLTFLAALTGAAVIFSLSIVYFNRSNTPAPTNLILVIGALDLLTIIYGLVFVVSIIDPKKYGRAAQKELKQTISEPELSPSKTSAGSFFDAFIHLEMVVREYLQEKGLYIPSHGSPRMSYSFREMINALYRNEKINHQFYEELLEINKYRNLVFHGHIKEADISMLEKTQSAAKKVEKIK